MIIFSDCINRLNIFFLLLYYNTFSIFSEHFFKFFQKFIYLYCFYLFIIYFIDEMVIRHFFLLPS